LGWRYIVSLLWYWNIDHIDSTIRPAFQYLQPPSVFNLAQRDYNLIVFMSKVLVACWYSLASLEMWIQSCLNQMKFSLCMCFTIPPLPKYMTCCSLHVSFLIFQVVLYFYCSFFLSLFFWVLIVRNNIKLLMWLILTV
jgi:hypothetical protein